MTGDTPGNRPGLRLRLTSSYSYPSLPQRKEDAESDTASSWQPRGCRSSIASALSSASPRRSTTVWCVETQNSFENTPSVNLTETARRSTITRLLAPKCPTAEVRSVRSLRTQQRAHCQMPNLFDLVVPFFWCAGSFLGLMRTSVMMVSLVWIILGTGFSWCFVFLRRV